ncbi:Lipoprotein [Saccharothrix espanaensis DSM 44229]|uniref:Lipoprotein n=2 Tax=Saccharothrix espanaensis TaxID=103731 RepID=K0K880_SACES|nr:Lipoprotein [Saccharothrix espanaensis DSM 44229]
MSSSSCATTESTRLTFAATGSAAEPVPWNDVLEKLALDHAMRAAQVGDGAVTVLFGPEGDVHRVDLTPMRTETEVEQDPDTASGKARTLLPGLRTALVDGTPAAGGLDLLGTFRRAVQATPAPGTVVLISSGVQTADPVDLRTLGWDFDVATTTDDLAARGLIPDASGRTVVMLGIGVTSGTQPRLPIPAEAKVIAFWHALCVRSGATRCEGRDTPPGPQPVSGRPQVPVVPVDATPTRCAGSQILPEAVTFAPNEPTLLAGADDVLRPIAEQLGRCPTTRRASFTGHTAAVPSGDQGFDLSRRRAEVIRTRLAELGAPAGALGPAEGVGSTRPIVDNLPGGVFAEALARHNRRVEITITDVDEEH